MSGCPCDPRGLDGDTCPDPSTGAPLCCKSAATLPAAPAPTEPSGIFYSLSIHGGMIRSEGFNLLAQCRFELAKIHITKDTLEESYLDGLFVDCEIECDPDSIGMKAFKNCLFYSLSQAPTEQQVELPITRSTYGSLEACEAEQARRNAALTEQAVELPPLVAFCIPHIVSDTDQFYRADQVDSALAARQASDTDNIMDAAMYHMLTFNAKQAGFESAMDAVLTACLRPAPTEAPKDIISGYQKWMCDTSIFPHSDDKRHPYDAFKAGMNFGIAQRAPDSRDAAFVIPSHLREFVEAVAHRFDAIDRETDDEFCKGCSGLSVWADGEAQQKITHHRPDCIVLRAEAILAQEKAQ